MTIEEMGRALVAASNRAGGPRQRDGPVDFTSGVAADASQTQSDPGQRLLLRLEFGRKKTKKASNSPARGILAIFLRGVENEFGLLK